MGTSLTCLDCYEDRRSAFRRHACWTFHWSLLKRGTLNIKWAQWPLIALAAAIWACTIHGGVTVSLQNSTFDDTLAKSRKHVSHFEHSQPTTVGALAATNCTFSQERETNTGLCQHDGIVPWVWPSRFSETKDQSEMFWPSNRPMWQCQQQLSWRNCSGHWKLCNLFRFPACVLNLNKKWGCQKWYISMWCCL